MTTPTLLDLAQRFDQLKPTDIGDRIAVAIDLEKRLGDWRDEFEERYTQLMGPSEHVFAEKLCVHCGVRECSPGHIETLLQCPKRPTACEKPVETILRAMGLIV